MRINSPCKGYLVYLICECKMSFRDINERLRELGYPSLTEAFVKKIRKEIKNYSAVYEEIGLGKEVFTGPDWAGVTELASDRFMRNRVNLLIIYGKPDSFISDWLTSHFIWKYPVESVTLYRKFYLNLENFSRGELEKWALQLPDDMAMSAYVELLRGNHEPLERYCFLPVSVDVKEALTDMLGMAYKKFKDVMDVPANDSSIHAFRMAQIVRDAASQLDKINKMAAAETPLEDDFSIQYDLSEIPTLEEYHKMIASMVSSGSKE